MMAGSALLSSGGSYLTTLSASPGVIPGAAQAETGGVTRALQAGVGGALSAAGQRLTAPEPVPAKET